MYIYIFIYSKTIQDLERDRKNLERMHRSWNISNGSSRLLKIIGLFCKRALQKRLYSAKETYDFKVPTNCSYRILANMRRKTDAFRNIPSLPRFDHPLEGFSIPFKILHTVLTSMHRKTFAIRNAGMRAKTCAQSGIL